MFYAVELSMSKPYKFYNWYNPIEYKYYTEYININKCSKTTIKLKTFLRGIRR